MASARAAVTLAFAILSTAAQAAGLCDVTAYGALNDGRARSTQAIRDAVQACAKAGGGTVYFPPGTYETGAIELASNIVLNIDAGATLRFHADLSEYPIVAGRMEGTEALTPAPLIGGRNLENVTITGRGTLTTDNAAWLKATNNTEARAMWTSIQNRLENKQPVPQEDFRKAAPALRPSFIRPMDSKNILIEGIHIVGSSMWAIHLLYCEHVVVRNVIVETYPGANPDGIDIDSSRDVRVSDSYFDTGDDAIVLKSGRGADGRRVGRPTENVTIANCTFHRAHGAVVIGSETSGGVRNVTASNIVSQGTEIGIRIKSGRSRGGVVENLRFDNWIIDHPLKDGILVTNYYVRIPEEPVSERTPVFRDISISNVTVREAPVVADIQGLPEMPIAGLRLTDVTGSGKRGVQAFNTRGLELHGVRINAQEGPPFLIRDSSDLELDRVEAAQAPAAMPVIRLDRVTGALVHSSRAPRGAKVFVSTAPGSLKSVVLDSNTLFGAKETEESSPDFWKDIDSPDRPSRR
jgi:polygalacturonase